MTGIELNLASLWWWQPLYLFFTPRVVIDGVMTERPWGKHLLPLPPGPHTVHISFPYFTRNETCPASTTVMVEPDRVTRVTYTAAPIMFMRGSIHVKS